jgi:hypothetical protein
MVILPPDDAGPRRWPKRSTNSRLGVQPGGPAPHRQRPTRQRAFPRKECVMEALGVVATVPGQKRLAGAFDLAGGLPTAHRGRPTHGRGCWRGPPSRIC